MINIHGVCQVTMRVKLQCLFHATFTHMLFPPKPWIFHLYTIFTQVLISRLSFLWFRSLLMMIITMVLFIYSYVYNTFVQVVINIV